MRARKSWQIQEASLTRHTLEEDLASLSSLKRWFTSQTSNTNAEVTHLDGFKEYFSHIVLGKLMSVFFLTLLQMYNGFTEGLALYLFFSVSLSVLCVIKLSSVVGSRIQTWRPKTINPSEDHRTRSSMVVHQHFHLIDLLESQWESQSVSSFLTFGG